MKKITNMAVAIGIIFTLLASCSKDKNNKPSSNKLGSDFPTVLNNIITPAILDTLKQHGAVINSGLTPPVVSGAYLFSPDYCSFDNSGDESAGTIYDDYKYQFTNQNTGNFTISVQYKDIVAQDDGSDGSATYISGSGNLFTIFAQTTGTSDGINYTSLQLISGEVQSGSIKNLQISTYLKNKSGDTNNDVLEPVGSTRIFNDQNGSSQATTFSVSKIIQNLNPNINSGKSFLALHKNNK